MTSEIKVDTISEQTSANGVTIDGLTIKDGNIQGSPALVGTTPSFTIGDGGAEDTKIVFDGNALDYYIGLDDSADNLIIGSGSTVGSNSLITIDSDGDFTLDSAADITLDVGGGDISLKGSGAEYGKFNLSGNSLNIHSSISDGDIVFKGSDGGSAITALTLDMSAAGNATFNGAIIANAGVSVDNITIDGTEIDLSSGDLTLDVAGGIVLDADDSGTISFRDGGTGHLSISNSSNDAVITSLQSDNDMIFKGVDGGSLITALTLDMSDAGTATFNHDVKLGDNSVLVLGAGSDMNLFHDGSNSYIQDAGTGDLRIRGSAAIKFEDNNGSETFAIFNDDGAVQLYYDNTLKFLTSSTGINLPVDGDSIKFGADSEVVLTHVHDQGLKITHDGGGDPDLILANTASASDGNQLGSVFFNGQNSNGDEHTYAFMLAQARDVTDGEEDGQLVFYGNKGGSDKQFITYGANANGASPTHEVCINEGSEDIDFRVESNGNANMLFVDGGNDKIGIGTNSPSELLEISNTSGDPGLRLNGAASGNPLMDFAQNGQQRAYLQYLDSGDKFTVQSDGEIRFLTGGSTVRLEIPSDGERILHRSGTNRYIELGSAGTNGGNSANWIRGAGNNIDLNTNGGTYGFEVSGSKKVGFATNGDVTCSTGSYGTISDERIKQDITDANSQWEDIKAVKVRNYKKKEDVRELGDSAPTHIGLVAQELETVSPNLIKTERPSVADIVSSSEFGTLYTEDDAETKDGKDAILYTADDQEVIDGNKNVGDVKSKATHSRKVGSIKNVTEEVKSIGYSILYMKAIKALQEAQTRIETLETKVEALEG
jgi:hypothetical protein